MKQKFRSTALSSKQMDFFSIFDFGKEENEIIPIVESPLDYINNAIAEKQSMHSEEKQSGRNWCHMRRMMLRCQVIVPNYSKIKFCIT
ncbi:Uncharacterised protein [Salmonella enterica subsp. enterica]|uniref:Uncharacterized protein n=1 Tax=Salmonella enterica I TaxID=59201 RepID=A0A379Y282_SALET|nr:Uncharacterised protein [Salmonella enterica subsp. enterica]